MFTIEQLLAATGGKLIFQAKNCYPRISGISLDSRTIKSNEAFIAIKGDNFDGNDFMEAAVKNGAGCVICAKNLRGKQKIGVNRVQTASCAVIEVKDTVKALGNIAFSYRNRFNIPVIAITGSNGKTTTKEMLAGILAAQFSVHKTAGTKNNHIGLPMTLLGLKPEHQVCVLELGTSNFGEIENLVRISCPNIGIVTNIGPSHLKYFKDLNGVFREKYSLIKGLKDPAVAVVNADDRLLRKSAHSSRSRPFSASFGIRQPADFSVTRIKADPGEMRFTVNEKYKFNLHTLGYNNIYNALAAIAAARIIGIAYKDIQARLSLFQFPKGRLRLIQTRHCSFIDDTYNSSPASLRQALLALAGFRTKGRKILVMGDMLELGEMKEACHYQAGIEAARVCDKFIAVGKLSMTAVAAARNAGLAPADIFSCDSSSQAKGILFKDIGVSNDDVVLVKGSRAMKMEEVFL